MNAPTWDLESIFEGGAAGAAFKAELSAVEAAAEALVVAADALPSLETSLEPWVELLCGLDELGARVSSLVLFAGAHAAADALSADAERAEARTTALSARLERAMVPVKDGVVWGSEAGFDALVAHPALEGQVPTLRRWRSQKRLLLPRGEAALAAELGRDGILAWGREYDKLSGRLTAKVGEQTLSISQVENMVGDGDPAVRATAFAASNAAWKGAEEACANALGHIVGTRQVINARRGVDELEDAFALNRVSRGSIEALMEAARRLRPTLSRYLRVKAGLLGRERLEWQDRSAPLPGVAARKVPWQEGVDFVLQNFESWHPELRDFAAMSLEKRWIEAENRPGKRPGGWCGSVPTRGETRIFMTWGENFRSTVTLAHELGHGFHDWVARDLPLSRRDVPMGLAETASVFAETLARDAALAGAKDPLERRTMLDQRLQAGVSFLMDIPFRFDLERRLYTLRAQGELEPEALCAATVELQREHFGDALASWSPYFWASKLHFYIPWFAFYNFPYAFGYLFASLVYTRMKAEGKGAHPRYVELLRRTGWEDAVPLARELLGADLERPETWEEAASPLVADLAAFEAG